MIKFARVFVPNPQYRFDTAPLLEIADEIVYVCNTSLFDDLAGEDYTPLFEGRVATEMASFDPKTDIIAHYGDALIFAMMVAFLFMYVLEEGDKLKIARFSTKANAYFIRELSGESFDAHVV